MTKIKNKICKQCKEPYEGCGKKYCSRSCRNASFTKEKPSYRAIHLWLKNNYGLATKCENKNCTYKNPKRYEWANISGEYKRDRSDYMQLCPSCHRKYDYKDETKELLSKICKQQWLKGQFDNR